MGGSLRGLGFIGNEIQPAQQRRPMHYCRSTGLQSRRTGHLIPYGWLFALPWLYRKRNPACGWSKSGPWPVEILTAFGRYLCAAHTNDEAPKPFGFGASFTLAAIYSRGTCRPTTIDVLMFHFRVRNGTGWDHQAMTTRFQGASLCSARCLPR